MTKSCLTCGAFLDGEHGKRTHDDWHAQIVKRIEKLEVRLRELGVNDGQ